MDKSKKTPTPPKPQPSPFTKGGNVPPTTLRIPTPQPKKGDDK